MSSESSVSATFDWRRVYYTLIPKRLGESMMLRNPLLVVFMVVCSSFFGERLAAAQAPPPGFWRGQSVSERVTDLTWVNLVVKYEGEFSFSTDAKGFINGIATVRYTMNVDDERLRGFIAKYNAASDLELSVAPGIQKLGPFLGTRAKFRTLQGVSGSYDGGTVVCQGAIAGTLDIARKLLHLEWAKTPASIPYKTYRVYPTTREVLGIGTGVAFSPWIADAVVTQPAQGHWEARAPVKPIVSGKSGTRTTANWSAHIEAAVKK